MYRHKKKQAKSSSVPHPCLYMLYKVDLTAYFNTEKIRRGCLKLKWGVCEGEAVLVAGRGTVLGCAIVVKGKEVE
jgi:hypothetical protein